MDIAQTNQQKPARSGCRTIIGLLMLMFLITSILINVILFFVIGTQDRSDKAFACAEDEFPSLNEKWSFGSGETKVARIKISGVITKQSAQGFFTTPEYDGVENILRQIRVATNDEKIKAIILEIDSPGGEITPTDEIYAALLNFKQSFDDRKIIAFVRGLAASGGYYVAASADWIIAEPTSLVGSLSAIMQTLNWKDLSEKIGINDVVIKTGENKDKLNPFREVKPEQVAYLQEVMDDMHRHFVGVVKAGRDIPMDDLNKIADGRIFNVRQALENNLIDQSGYWSDVMIKISDMLEQDSVKIIRYEEKRLGFFKWLPQVKSFPGIVDLLDNQSLRTMYLWRP